MPLEVHGHGTPMDEWTAGSVHGRIFSRQGGLKRHKCLDEQNKTVKEQQLLSSVQLAKCGFKCSGD